MCDAQLPSGLLLLPVRSMREGYAFVSFCVRICVRV